MLGLLGADGATLTSGASSVAQVFGVLRKGPSLPMKKLINDPDSYLVQGLRGFGRERLNILEADAREHIRVADGMLTLAERQGLDTAQARELYEQAWDQLLLTENSDGRGFDPHSSRKIFVAQAAVNAVKLAREAMQAIG